MELLGSCDKYQIKIIYLSVLKDSREAKNYKDPLS